MWKWLFISLFATQAYAHEMTPTYFELKPSLYDNVYVTQLSLFNKRQDVEYYEVNVYDENFNPIAFATKDKVLKVPTYGKSTLEIYVRRKDVDEVTYVCTQSMLLKENVGSTGVTSRICSRLK